MASLFPTSPVNGQIAIVNNITYSYDSTKGWLKSSKILDSTPIINITDNTKIVKVDVSGNTTGISGTLKTNFTTAKTLNLPDKNGELAVAPSIVTLNTSSNITLGCNVIYEVITPTVANSLLTLPSGTKTGDTIQILIACTGFNSATTFVIGGNINGNATETVINDKSFVEYKFVWSQTLATWIFSISR